MINEVDILKILVLLMFQDHPNVIKIIEFFEDD